MAARSSTRLPREVSSRTSGRASSTASVSSGAAKSVAMTAIPLRLLNTRVSTSRSKRFSAATSTRICCAGAHFVEDFAGFSGPRRLGVSPFERSFPRLSDIGLPFPLSTSAFDLKPDPSTVRMQYRRAQVADPATAAEKKELVILKQPSEPAPSQLRHKNRTEQTF